MLGVEPTGAARGPRPREPRAGGVEELSERYGLAVDPDAIVEDLPVGIQQRVEILKALYRDARCLILDEPTAVLTPAEIDELLEIIRGLKPTGGARSCSSPTSCARCWPSPTGSRVLRRGPGRRPHARPLRTTDAGQLATMMVGRDVQARRRQGAGRARRAGARGRRPRRCSTSGSTPCVDGVSLDVRAGEILAVAGVAGQRPDRAGRGDHRPAPAASGTVRLDGDDVTGASPGRALRPRPRPRPRGPAAPPVSSAPFSVADNLVLNRWRSRPFAHGLRHRPRRRARATPSSSSTTSTSGRRRSTRRASRRCRAATSRR